MSVDKSSKPIQGANERLGLPRSKMQKVTIAFDVDGTLRNNTVESRVEANEDIRELVRIFTRFKNVRILVWSGSGELYARQVAKEMHIEHWVDSYAGKTDHETIKLLGPVIAIDDIQDTAIGDINLIVREK